MNKLSNDVIVIVQSYCLEPQLNDLLPPDMATVMCAGMAYERGNDPYHYLNVIIRRPELVGSFNSIFCPRCVYNDVNWPFYLLIGRKTEFASFGDFLVTPRRYVADPRPHLKHWLNEKQDAELIFDIVFIMHAVVFLLEESSSNQLKGMSRLGNSDRIIKEEIKGRAIYFEAAKAYDPHVIDNLIKWRDSQNKSASLCAKLIIESFFFCKKRL